jgi:hypothetical protein
LAIAAVVGILLAGYYMAPEDPEKPIYKALQRDGRYTFEDAKGPPKLIRWPATNGVIETPAPDGEGFAFQSLEFCPLELLSEPPGDYYRFRARVRHERTGGHLGACGIFFGLKKYRTPKGDVLCGYVLGFNDLVHQMPPELGVPRLNTVKLLVRCYEGSMLLDQSIAAAQVAPFEPARALPGRGPWRDLAVEVTAANVRVYWAGELVSELTRQDLSARGRLLVDGNPGLAGVDPTFHPKGSFGLYVENGSASFKDVVLEARPNP